MASNDETGVKTPLLHGSASKSDLSTCTTSSVALPSSTVLEPPNQRRSRWWSIRVMYGTMFMSSVTFTLTMATLWPFLKVVDPGATPSFLGWVVASYSLGQLLASPLFGWWSARRQAREPLLCSLFLQVGANLFYAYVQSVPANGGGCLVAARAVMGFAAGNAAVVRAYVSGATTITERTGAMANVSLFQSVGFIMGPVIQTVLTYVGYPGPVEKEWLHFNMYTSPAVLSAFFTVVNFVLVLVFFRLHTVSDASVINTTVHGEEEEEEEEEEDAEDGGSERSWTEEGGRGAVRGREEDGDGSKGPPDYVGVGLSVFLFFVTFFVFTIFETIGTALTMDMYGWTKAQASRNIGIVLGVAGLVAIAVFLVVSRLSKKGVDERFLLLAGYVFCFVGFFILLPWGHDLPALSPASVGPPITISTKAVDRVPVTPPYGQFWTEDSRNTAAAGNRTTTADNWTTTADNWTTTADNWTTTADNWTTTEKWTTVDTSSVVTTISGNVTTAVSTGPPTTATLPSGNSTTAVTVVPTMPSPVGCPWYFAWCGTVPKIQLWQFLLGTFFIAVGYPMCNAMTYSIYSKVLGSKPQGLWMGVITASGSLARTLGPVFVSQMYDAQGPRVTFAATCAVLVLTLVVNGVGFRRLVPFDLSPYRGGRGGGGGGCTALRQAPGECDLSRTGHQTTQHVSDRRNMCLTNASQTTQHVSDQRNMCLTNASQTTQHVSDRRNMCLTDATCV
ncbi:major facilitator superfamily domain-containing protein 8-like [Babylonia areolata]|uniref:major facilitator superfamily domain-containing protein 8-like n=1 Tax=Babylonia areolata TaxID=304850 RepID=UPI003FD1B82D